MFDHDNMKCFIDDEAEVNESGTDTEDNDSSMLGKMPHQVCRP